jgi:predicted nucleic acid-binding protein
MRALAPISVLYPSPRPITLDTHDAAIVIAAGTGYAFYDALIIASALEAGCATLFSEDLQDGQVINGRLTIRNPFNRRQG